MPHLKRNLLLAGALLPNTSLRFTCRQVELEVVNAATAWTGACSVGDRLSIPAKHMSGRYWAPDPVLDELEANGQVVVRYAAGHNFNGSARDIAGVSNAAGNVVGLMPHPEHAVDALTGSADGLKLTAITQDVGNASEELDATADGAGLTVAFNPDYLAAGVEAVSVEQITLSTIDALKPAVVRGVGRDDYLYLLMPVRVP